MACLFSVCFCELNYTLSNSTYRKLNRQRSVFPSDTALLKALYLATFEATKNGLLRSETGHRFTANWALCTKDVYLNNWKTGQEDRRETACSWYVCMQLLYIRQERQAYSISSSPLIIILSNKWGAVQMAVPFSSLSIKSAAAAFLKNHLYFSSWQTGIWLNIHGQHAATFRHLF